MKFKAILLALLLSAAAFADVNIEDVQVRRRGQDMNIRVNLYNPSATTQRDIRITLYARPNAQSGWELIKVWNNIATLAAGNRLARDFFEAGNPRLQQIAGNPAFEARAVVEAPGMESRETVGIYHGDDH